jgi:hypothetical protein
MAFQDESNRIGERHGGSRRGTGPSSYPPKAPVLLLAAAVAALYVLHQDLWFWRSARPLVFGFLPVGLAYHAAYCLAAAALMWALTRFAWPSHLEREQR